jgi:hypothetical protein
MMAKSVRRNGTALSGRWKFGGEANRRKEDEKRQAEAQEKEIRKSIQE